MTIQNPIHDILRENQDYSEIIRIIGIDYMEALYILEGIDDCECEVCILARLLEITTEDLHII